MSKMKTAFFCQNCGMQSAKWVGKCPSCGEWNTFVEEVIQRTDTIGTSLKSNQRISKPQPTNSIQVTELQRIPLVDRELNRVLGGGLVQGSLILFGGEPGIGKSTLMLQVALQQQNMQVLYVSGEESTEQIKMRVDRIGFQNERCLLLMETLLENILIHVSEVKPQLLVIDSIQTLETQAIESAPGSVSQVRECTARLMKIAKETGTVIILIGHITKEGTLAGPKILEHMVDIVLQFEGDRHHLYRLLRAHKNRFGSTGELGIYEMQGAGLVQVPDPSRVLVHTQTEQLSGTAIAAGMEGVRPMLLEIQALVSTAVYGTPQRSTTGFDIRRLNMLLAVLEKRCGFRLGMKDVFLNIAGGLRLEDPAMDMAVIAAILSSNEDIALPRLACFAGEVGLSGEIRPVVRMEQRILEASKLGFEEIFISSFAKSSAHVAVEGLRITTVSKVDELFQKIFG